MEIIQFGGTKKEQTELANLVLRGEKVATSSLKNLQKLEGNKASKVGDLWEIRDGLNETICMVEVTQVSIKSFGQIDESFAKAEGDGDFNNWYDIHYKYYSQKLQTYQLELSNETKLECVYFKIKK